MTDEPEAEKTRRIQHIRNLYAFVLFSQHRFEDSLKIFAELGTGKKRDCCPGTIKEDIDHCI